MTPSDVFNHYRASLSSGARALAAASDPAHDPYRRRFLIITGIAIAIYALAAFIQLARTGTNHVLTVMEFIFLILEIVVIYLAYTRRIRLAASLYLWGASLGTIPIILSTGGATSLAIINVFLLLQVSGWLLDRGQTIAVWLALSLLIAAIHLVGQSDPVIAGYILTLLTLTLITALLQAASYDHRFAQLRRAWTELRHKSAAVAQLSTVVDQNPSSIAICDLEDRVTYVNEGFLRTESANPEPIGMDVIAAHWPQVRPDDEARLRQALRQRTPWRGEVHAGAQDRPQVYRVLVLPVRVDEVISHRALISTDVTRRRQVEEDLVRATSIDPITGLANWGSLVRHLTLDSVDAPAGLVVMLIDDFERVVGVQEQDRIRELLLGYAHVLTEMSVRYDLRSARIEGGEFAVLVLCPPECTDADAGALTEAFAGALHERLPVPLLPGASGYLPTTACIGSTLVRGGSAQNAQEALRRARIALNAARTLGPHQRASFREEMEAEVDKRLDYEASLRAAVDTGGLSLVLQDQHAPDGTTVGAEALVRWDHPVHGPISPAVFIPMAEQSDLIARIDQWVLRQVCDLWVELAPITPPLRLSTNISPVHFGMDGFLEQVLGIVDESGADRAAITLELTEGILIHDPEKAIRTMTRLREAGFRLSIDDFGTGYASLSYLKRLPFDELKIDRSFVAGVLNDSRDHALIGVFVEVARQFDLSVVAEGVETRAQADLLAGMGDMLLQGFHCARPVPMDAWRSRVLGR
ncbi:MAG: putative bifunctional diguanylate cyclase/phosphodiesterase [Actinomycetales bacterium]